MTEIGIPPTRHDVSWGFISIPERTPAQLRQACGERDLAPLIQVVYEIGEDGERAAADLWASAAVAGDVEVPAAWRVLFRAAGLEVRPWSGAVATLQATPTGRRMLVESGLYMSLGRLGDGQTVVVTAGITRERSDDFRLRGEVVRPEQAFEFEMPTVDAQLVESAFVGSGWLFALVAVAQRSLGVLAVQELVSE